MCTKYKNKLNKQTNKHRKLYYKSPLKRTQLRYGLIEMPRPSHQRALPSTASETNWYFLCGKNDTSKQKKTTITNQSVIRYRCSPRS